ncbi:hypothetical protein KORDIASMS9_01819 [Kordia sp. SMS9]|uniref:hypothetical protein n=1 Tax=Kordia sp. SMS9 TaxID=2282170 RepID=UPI000E0D122E|nr:hypothetical protein [Kordia sp. SMS9]AXG69594.1 hypothetical protein KORDIASMS9_01819 [Kordia sp. SMS9]
MNEKKYENDTVKQEKAWRAHWNLHGNDIELELPTEEDPSNTVTIKKGQIHGNGLTLKDVSHNGYRMAYDIGVIAIWVYPKKNLVDENGQTYKPYKLVLGHKDFEQVNDDYSELRSDFKAEKKAKDNTVNSNSVGSLANFNTYKKSIEHVITASWKSRKKLFGEKSSHLYITQKYILTDYNDVPAHEPTGGIFAARMHPITKIYYENRNDGYLYSIRVDYRLHLNLDTYPEKQETGVYVGYGYGSSDTFSRVQKENVLNNHAGLFKDVDGLEFGLPANRAVFESSEKPIIAEIFSDGIIRGSNKRLIENRNYTNFWGKKKEEQTIQNTWDNIHWWGAGGNIHASAPGAFHALHIHWRWAEILQRKDSIYDITGITHEGEEQFVGQSKGGVLTDPRIQNQSIRFAIVKNDSLPKWDHSEHSTENFGDFFENLHGVPEPILIGTKPDEGANLVLYYSTEVFAEKQPYGRVSARGLGSEGVIKVPLEGNVFLHGIFFAHQDEKSSGTLVGSQYSYYINPDKPNETAWKRNPEK